GGSGSAALFFFSSRRRHTRFSRDWSSDVCSSDLGGDRVEVGAVAGVVVADLRVRADRAFPRIFGAPQLLAGGRVERGQAARSSPQFGPSAEHPVLPVGSESGGGAQFVVAVLGDRKSVV